ncbi:MAG: hypothetical protein LUD72_01475 [Bacteroidales bacterium]|nr:hypothetical protein [Bacteroidales bacterium]
MKRTRLYNTATGKWEWWTIMTAKTPWRVAWKRLRAFLRYARRHRTPLPKTYEFDPETLRIRDPRGERRQRRRDRRERFLAKATNALNAMVEMQKFIN